MDGMSLTTYVHRSQWSAADMNTYLR